MTDPRSIAAEFAALTGFKANPFHPLVWINGNPEIGANVYIGGMSEINATQAHVRIGDHCDIASFVSINCADSHRKCIGVAADIERRDIVLEDHVFVGSHCVIKGGAHIGHHSVVAAGTIVEGRKIPPYSLIIGNPMTVKEGYYTPTDPASEPVPHNRPSLGREEEVAAVNVIRSGQVAQGAQVRAFEQEFCEFLGLPSGHAVAVSSGTAALYVALHVLRAKGRMVALPAYACASLLQALRMAGGVPVFIDNAPGSPNLDVLAAASANAEIALVPYTYGLPSDISPLSSAPVIEDCAHALGAKVNGAPVGLSGDIGICSFYATKLMTSGGAGGMLMARDRAIIDAIRDFREFDQRTDSQFRFNFSMTDLQAAIGREQLRKLPRFLQRRQQIFEAYRAAGLDLLDTTLADCEPVRYRAVLRSAEPPRIIAALEASGVRAIVPLEEWELLSAPDSFPVAAHLCRTSVSLPCYPSLTDSAVARVVSAIVRS